MQSGSSINDATANACRRSCDGGKKIKGVKIHIAVDKYGFPLGIDVSPANRHDTKAIVPVLRQLADRGFQDTALGDLGYRGETGHWRGARPIVAPVSA